MQERMLYLDHAATTPMHPEVWEAMSPYVGEAFGNASGSHGVARQAKNALEAAREQVAALLGAQPLEIVFTGGGTEADNLAVQGAALAGGRRGAVVTSAVEHEAVLETVAFLEELGCPVHLVGVDQFGFVDPLEVAAAVGPQTAVVSVMSANNETGVLQPVQEIAAAVKAVNPAVAVHTDAVQSFVSRDLNVDKLGVDMLSLAAHKFGGPKGVGLLYVRSGVGLEPVLHGGGQELGRRSGTHNVMGAVGMAKAMEVTVGDRMRFTTDVGSARGYFEEGLLKVIPDLEFNAPLEARLVQHSHVRIPGVRNETLLVRLDRSGLAVSAGSSCQSGAADVSHVLAAMGFDDERARECLRFSFGWTTK
ncbi:MAG: cysteine desulfurase, partial [Acidimicrobiia bacterium]|nr:cysteine desulfurase [Acidimicrobiia bacterium]